MLVRRLAESAASSSHNNDNNNNNDTIIKHSNNNDNDNNDKIGAPPAWSRCRPGRQAACVRTIYSAE